MDDKTWRVGLGSQGLLLQKGRVSEPQMSRRTTCRKRDRSVGTGDGGGCDQRANLSVVLE